MNLFNTMNMKTIHRLVVITVLAAITFSCVEDDDFNIPDTAPAVDVQVEGTFITLNALYTAMQQDDYLSRYDADSDLYTVGYVVSSDEGGNFFEELIIQDSPENPSRGARVSIDVSPLSARYDVGRKVFIKLAGLTVTTNTAPEFSSGNLQNADLLGMNIGRGTTLGRVEQIGAFEEENILVRSADVATIVYNPVAFTDVNATNIYTAVKLDDVQFDRRQLDLTFAGEASDRFDGDRTLVSCSSTATALFQTSTFADFKSVNIPDGRGFINAVVATDFFGENHAYTINEPADVNLNDPNRCDPVFLDCNNPNAGNGVNTVFSQNFENVFVENQLDTDGYTNVNVSGGNERYRLGTFSNNRYLQVNAFNQPDDPMIAWFVTPAIDFNASTDEALSFDIQANFDQGGLLEVFVTNAYTGDPTTTAWQQTDANIPSGPSGGFANSFTAVEDIDISCIDGTDVRVAFKYTASNPAGTTTRYHIDNILVTGN